MTSEHPGEPGQLEDSSAGQSPRYPIDSVDNALKLLLMFRDGRSVGVSEASRRLGVARSTAHRLIAMLTHHGLVRQVPATRAYTAGPVLVELGLAALRESDIRPKARPFIEDVVRGLDETVHLVTLQGAQLVYLDCAEGTKALRAGSRIGSMLPAHCTAGGKVLLAGLPEERLHELYPDEALEPLTSRSVASRAELFAQLEKVRQRGYATNDGESETQLRAVAVSIRDRNGEVRGGLTLAAPEHRLPFTAVPAVAGILNTAAEKIGTALP